MILLLTTFCIGVTFDTTRLLGIVVLAMTTYILPWLLIPLIGALGGVMVPLIIFILGTVFNVSRAWSIFALSIGYPLTWIGTIGVWMLRLLCF